MSHKHAIFYVQTRGRSQGGWVDSYKLAKYENGDLEYYPFDAQEPLV